MPWITIKRLKLESLQCNNNCAVLFCYSDTTRVKRLKGEAIERVGNWFNRLFFLLFNGTVKCQLKKVWQSTKYLILEPYSKH